MSGPLRRGEIKALVYAAVPDGLSTQVAKALGEDRERTWDDRPSRSPSPRLHEPTGWRSRTGALG